MIIIIRIGHGTYGCCCTYSLLDLEMEEVSLKYVTTIYRVSIEVAVYEG